MNIKVINREIFTSLFSAIASLKTGSKCLFTLCKLRFFACFFLAITKNSSRAKLFNNLILLFVLSPSLLLAEEKRVDAGVKQLSGISIIGNKEAPKSLYIVPWQNSEVGVATSLNSGLLDDSMRPLDKEVFLRELDFYELSHGKSQ